MKRFRATTLAVLVLATVQTMAAGPFVQASSDEVLTNETIAAMTKAGLGPDVIVAKIRSAPSTFDVSVDALIRLKQDGVSDEVINAMIEAGEAPPPSSNAALTRARRTAGPPLPPTPPESGIYYAERLDQEEQLVLVEPSVYTQSKQTGAWKTALTYGIAKTRFKTVLPGAHARVAVATRRPVFYFYFDVPSPGLSNANSVWGPATTAGEFVLARMDARKTTRELTVGETGTYTGTSYGVATKAVRPFDYDRLAPGIYRVTPQADLEDGEYCFLYGGSVATSGAAAGPKLFDFRVKAKP
jgi:hypothetical protein